MISSSLGENYTYDGVGNRLTGPNTTDTMNYNAGNEQLNLKAVTYEYDINGNRIKKTGAGGVVTNYTYNDENRLIEVTKGTDVITYTYDPFGRRIQKNVNGTITNYLYDNEHIIIEYNNADNIKAKYTHGLGIDEPLAVKKNADIYYYHADGLGSITALSDASGNIVQRYEYDSFGNMTKTGNINQPFTYTAREHDNETGLYYYRARYYDSKAGRFITRDPIGFGGGINQYTYVINDPVNYTDPSGELFPVFLIPWVAGIVAGTMTVGAVAPCFLGTPPLPKGSPPGTLNPGYPGATPPGTGIQPVRPVIPIAGPPVAGR